VSTRPVIKEYGLGMTVEQVVVELARLKSLFVLLPDNVAVYEQWEQLVIQHKTKGKHSHDVRLIAAMKAHGLTRILTFDRDFEGYSEIAVVNPQSAEAGGTRT
jgi:predicted nucleic acid-binding protein